VLTPQNLLTRKKGDFMSRSEIRAIVCAGKIGIDSSIQAQRAGEVMSQNWRIYCLFDIWNQTGTI